MLLALINAPSTFQPMMDVVVKHLQFVRVCIDDVVIFFRSVEENFDHVREVFKRLSSRDLKAKLAKCHFAQTTIFLLDHVTSSDEIRDDDEKLAITKDSPMPSTQSEVRFFWAWPDVIFRSFRGPRRSFLAYTMHYTEKPR